MIWYLTPTKYELLRSLLYCQILLYLLQLYLIVFLCKTSEDLIVSYFEEFIFGKKRNAPFYQFLILTILIYE